MTTPAIKRTSEMTYPLEEPKHWHLYKAMHQYWVRNENKRWFVEFINYGDERVRGFGSTLEKAWQKAVANVTNRDIK